MCKLVLTQVDDRKNIYSYTLRRYSRHLLKAWWVCQGNLRNYLCCPNKTNCPELGSSPLDVNWMRTSWGTIQEPGEIGKLKNLPQLSVALRGVIKLIKDRKSARTSIIYCAWVWSAGVQWSSGIPRWTTELSRKKWEKKHLCNAIGLLSCAHGSNRFSIFVYFLAEGATITNT